MKKFYVYGLTNPLKDNQFFYIGKGTGDRCHAHFKERKVVNPHKTNTIKQIEAAGLVVGIVKIKDGLTADEAYSLETELILKYGRVGYEANGILTNICLDQRPPSLDDMTPEMLAEWRKRHSDGNKRAWADGTRTVTEPMKRHLDSIRSKGGKAKCEKYGTWNKGLTKDDPRIQKWMKSREGYTHSEEVKSKMSETRSGVPKSDEHKKAISEARIRSASGRSSPCLQSNWCTLAGRWMFRSQL